MNQRQRLLSIVIAFLALAVMACTCSVPKLSGPAPAATVPVSRDAADRMQKKIDQALAQSKSSGQWQFTVTESELTSFLVRELEKSKAQGDEILVTNPQVKLTKGQVWGYGTFVSGSSKINGLVVVLPQVQHDRVKIQIVRADFGPIPVPQPLLDQINEQIQTSVDDGTSNIILTSIAIREGEMDVTGRRK